MPVETLSLCRARQGRFNPREGGPSQGCDHDADRRDSPPATPFSRFRLAQRPRRGKGKLRPLTGHAPPLIKTILYRRARQVRLTHREGRRSPEQRPRRGSAGQPPCHALQPLSTGSTATSGTQEQNPTSGHHHARPSLSRVRLARLSHRHGRLSLEQRPRLRSGGGERTPRPDQSLRSRQPVQHPDQQDTSRSSAFSSANIPRGSGGVKPPGRRQRPVHRWPWAARLSPR